MNIQSIKSFCDATMTTSIASIYTSTNVVSNVTSVVVKNTTGSSITVSIDLRDNATLASSEDDMMVQALTVPANDTVTVPSMLNQNISKSGTIQAVCSDANAARIRVSGRTYA